MAEERTETDGRIRLCGTQSNLRCGIARFADGEANTVTFRRTLTDPGNRARIIRRVRQSDSPELCRLADEAARYNVGQLAGEKRGQTTNIV
jgi:hypothetical protein